MELFEALAQAQVPLLHHHLRGRLGGRGHGGVPGQEAGAGDGGGRAVPGEDDGCGHQDPPGEGLRGRPRHLTF